MQQQEKTEKKTLASPLLSYYLTCPICSYDRVRFFTLKAKSIAFKPNIYDIPIYEDSPKFEALDFNELFFSVCPKCYYTGTRKLDFISEDPINHSRVKAVVDRHISDHWTKNKNEIEDLLVDNFLSEDAFEHPRSDEGLIASHKLGIYRAGLEIQYKIPYSYLKRAKYHLKHHYIYYKVYAKDNEEILKAALSDLETVFLKSDFPEKSYEFEVCYLAAVISVRIQDEAKAQAYIKVLDKTKGELTQKARTDKNVSTHEITNWLTKTKNFWQVRDESQIWDLEKPVRF